MKVIEILEKENDENIGKGDYHPESYFAPIVAQFVNEEGIAYWDDIFAYVELHTNLTAADLTLVSNHKLPRWQKNITNLHAHRTLEGGKFGDIVRIKGGFATRQAAEEAGIEILPDNSIAAKNPGNRSPQYIKKKAGFVVSTAYHEMGRPQLDDTSITREEIEHMIGMNSWLPDTELVAKAKEIITKHMK